MNKNIGYRKSNKLEDKNIRFSKIEERIENLSRQLAILRTMERQIDHGNHPTIKDAPDDDEFKKLVKENAEIANQTSIPTIEIILKNIDLIREYLLIRKEELEQDG